MQIYACGDASERMLGIAVYLRAFYEDGTTSARLIQAKSKVVKKDVMTLARKELVASLLCSRLATHCAETTGISTEKIFCFTDSKTALCWLSKPPETWRVFVYNRTRQILEMVPRKRWSFIPGEMNPADHPSRGVSIKDMVNKIKWFDATEIFDNLPEETNLKADMDLVNLEKKLNGPISFPVFGETNPMAKLLDISNWNKFVRATAYILRLKLKKAERPETLEISEEEVKRAILFWVKLTQDFSFEEEIEALKEGKKLPRHSPLLCHDIFLDEDGLIRRRGRINEAPIDFDERHPVFLPSFKVKKPQEINQRIESRLVNAIHLQQMHCGPKQTNQYLRKEFWLLSSLPSIRSVINQCFRCQMAAKDLAQQRMADLPVDRLEMYAVWENVGMDFTASFRVKDRVKRRKDKKMDKQETIVEQDVYILIFCDLVTRAVHLEVTDSMNTNTVVMAIQRAMAAVGCFKKLRSDEARYFLAAKKELDKLFKGSDMQFEFEVNTPRAAWQGGCWERLIASVKMTLRRVLGKASVDKETFITVVKSAESLINDRPISTESEADGFRAITPSQLCIGRLRRQLPSWKGMSKEENVSNDAKCAKKLWKLRQTLGDHFWSRFRHEYMQTVLARPPKWTEDKPSLELDQIVLVSDEQTPRGRWPLARVSDVEKTRSFIRDGKVRTVEVTLADGRKLRRAVHKLVPLPH